MARKAKSLVLSLKTIALHFPAGSLERVYLHGIWQQSRGRNPSESLRNNSNLSPRASFETAEQLIGEYFQSLRRMAYFRVAWQDFSHSLVQAIRDRRAPQSTVWEFLRE